jgi:putative ABC transport system permease protein
VDAATLDRGLTLEYVSGGSAGLAGRGLLVDETTAEARGWDVGDPVEAVSAGGQRTELTVGGVYAVNQAVGSAVLSLETDAALGGPALDRYVYVVLADGTDASTARAAIESVVDAYPVVGLKDREEFAGEQKAQVDQVLLLINALLVLSVVIAVLGIVNTLAMSVLERTREIGLLRAVGMGRRQLRRTVRLEAVLISVYGSVLGLGLGLVLGIALTRSLSDQGITELVVPGAQLAGFLVLGALIGVVAAAWPARRAARMQVLDAIATA